MSFATYPSLNGAVVFVTGGASGIGEQIVRAFAAQGFRIGFVDIDTERGGALADELGRQDATIHFEPCDLRDIDALKRAFAALETRSAPQPFWSTMPPETTGMTGKRSRPTTTTSASPPICAICSSPFSR